jgi:hypothetical protein
MQQQLNKTVVDPNRIMSGPPSLVYAGFEGAASQSQRNLEQARSKFLLDKLTGKLPQRSGLLEPISETRGDSALDEETKANLEITQDQVDKGQASEANKPKKAQKWTDLDKYIELLLDSKSEEETVFLYLNPSKKGDPYDLQVSNYSKKDKERYYTLSGKGLTQYDATGPVDFMSLGQWLIERDSYNHIKELSFFKQFKKWKFMRMWKKTIKYQNRMKAQNALEDKLFMLQDHFHEHLQKHRKLMIEMSSYRFVDSCKKGSGETMTAERFAEAQETQRTKVKQQIEDMSDSARSNVKQCIEKVLKELRDRILGEITLDEQRKKNNPTQSNNTGNMKRKEVNSVYDKLGFPAGMTYGHRSSLRKECIKFLRFAYLVDFLSLEALASIYTGSVEQMNKRLKDLDEEADDRIEEIMVCKFDDTGTQANTAQRGLEPLFYINVTLDDSRELPSEEIKDIQIEDFVLPPRGTSQVEDFDLLAHIEIEEVKEEEEEEDGSEDAEDAEDDIIVPKFRKTTPSIHNYWI